MNLLFLFALTDWISWPLIVLICIIVAICKKDRVRAAIKLKWFQFSLEANNVKSKEE